MATKNNRVLKGVGYLWLGNTPIYEVTNFSLNVSLQGFEAQLRTGVCVIPTFARSTLTIETASYNIDLLAQLTGGTLAAGSMRIQEETLTKSTNALTLSQTPEDSDRLIIFPEASNNGPLSKVAGAPSVGEFSISGTTVTLNASESATKFLCIYPYSDVTNGETLQINPTNLPTTNYKFLGYVGTTDKYTGENGKLVVQLAKVQRQLGDLNLNPQAQAQANISFGMNVINSVPGDFKISEHVA